MSALATARPAPRRLVSETVFEALLSDVLSGRLGPGDPLPSERALSEAFSVNRHAVREAIKRLQQAGLVAVSHGGATRVNDWRRTGGLELLTSLAGAARGPERQSLLRDIAELRAVVGADLARRCAAERGRPPTPVDRCLHFGARAEQYVAYWETIAEGGSNLAYRLALNTLVAAQRHGEIDPRIYAREIDDPTVQQALAAAISDGEAAEAHRLAAALLDRTVSAL